MSRYRIHATVVQTWKNSENVTFEVEADSEEDALPQMYNKADLQCRRSSWDAEYDGSEIENYSIELIEGDGDHRIPRCDKTPDMFLEAA